MQFIQRAAWPFFTPSTRIRRIRSAVHYLMRHVGLAGRCDCVLTRDERGRVGIWLRIETSQVVPRSERLRFQSYFRRKLREFGELGRGWELRLMLCDRDELMLAAPADGRVSSQRIASIVRAFNGGESEPMSLEERVHEMRDSVRQRLSARRVERVGSDYAPLLAGSLTELGALSRS